jgi:ParB/RepB/Spo0J family partition protein
MLINMSDVWANEDFNCRGHFDKIEVAELAQDIDSKAQTLPDTLGLIQPVSVRVLSADETKQSNGKPYALVAGFRRYFACQVLKRDKIAVNVMHGISENQAAIINLAENMKRKDLNMVQEAQAIAKLHRKGIPRDHVARELGVSSGWVQIRYNLLELPEEIQKEAAMGMINQKQVKELWSLKDSGKQFEAVRAIKDAKAKGEGVPQIKKIKDNPDAPKVRSRTDIHDMIVHVAGVLGMGFHTRCLAWTGQEIGTRELLADLEREAKAKGLNYKMPASGTIFNGE